MTPADLATERAALAHAEQQAAYYARRLEAEPDDAVWLAKVINGWLWNVAQAKARIARLESDQQEAAA